MILQLLFLQTKFEEQGVGYTALGSTDTQPQLKMELDSICELYCGIIGSETVTSLFM